VADIVDIDHVRLGNRPLVVCDIDEVVLEFISPFTTFLRANNYDLLPRSFRLHGNIVSLSDGTEPSDAVIAEFQESFFGTQDLWQMPAPGAVETLAALSTDADIVFLTAMPPRHQPVRRALLDRFGLDFPMVATEQPKGPVVAQLHRNRTLPVVFIDDIARNLHSVREQVPECLLITMMANADFRAFAPVPSEGVQSATNWDEAEELIRAHILR
jgi:hypothetical protein